VPDKGKLKPVSYRRARRRTASRRAAATLPLERIVSGGQTGVDREALNVAMEFGLPHGGWCPRGRLAEDGNIPPAYRLQETPEPVYAQRTEWNVRDSDGTVIFSVSPTLTGGSALTRELAEAYGKPCLHVCEERDARTAVRKLRAFLRRHGIRTLNVAGPRLSTEPGAAAFARRVLEALLRD
jgi:hypothetical protein